MNYLYLLPLLICAVACAPARYDQRQEGEVNVRADLQNFVIIALIPKLDGAGTALLSTIAKSLPQRKSDKPYDDLEADERSDQLARNEPFASNKNTPYHVDISHGKPNQSQRRSDNGQFRRRNSAASNKQPSSPVENPVPDVLQVKDNHYVEKKGRELTFDDEEPKEKQSSKDETNEFSSESASVESVRSSKDSGLLLLGAMEQCGPGRYRDNEGLCRFDDE